MIIHDFHFVGIPLAPDKTDAPLVVDADAVLSSSAAVKRFQVIAWWRPQIPKLRGNVQLSQLTLCHSLECAESLDGLPGVELCRFSRPEGPDHLLIV